jgi:polysaccharide export outer membrane protein
MHYHSFSKKYIKSVFSILLMIVSLPVFAQNTTPQTAPTQPQADPSQISNQQAVEFYNQAKGAGLSDMDIERAALQKGYTLDDISAVRRRLQQTSKDNTQKDPNRDKIDDTREQDDRDELDEETNNERDSTTLSRHAREDLTGLSDRHFLEDLR